MEPTIEQGTLVNHIARPDWGIGKVVSANAVEVWVYFSRHPAGTPDARVLRFNWPSEFLRISDETSHQDVDHLPPYKDGRFQTVKTSLTLAHARDRFLGYFPRGFADPGYWKHERGYKLAAHERFRDQFRPNIERWIGEGDVTSLRIGLLNVYTPSERPSYGLNLLSPRYEFPAFKESLSDDGPLLAYAKAALAMAEEPAPTTTTFDRLADAVAGLPTRKGGIKLEKWTVMTWLPFIADPENHMFLKPEMTKAFASVMPFELQYESHPNLRTYERLQAMARLLKQRISDAQLNPDARQLDMIDVHSFMWIVVEYGKNK